jgi:Tol biopolymer transport system component
MRLKYGFPVLFIFVLGIVLAARADTASLGGTKTYLPITQRGNGYDLPGGNLLLYTVGYQAEATIFLSPPPPATPIQLTTTIGSTHPRFSLDGNHILYEVELNDGQDRFRVMGANGSSNRVLVEGHYVRTPDWASDSRTLAYFDNNENNAGRLQVVSLDNPTPTTLVYNPSTSPIWDNTALRLYYVKATYMGADESIRRINVDGSEDSLIIAPENELRIHSQLAGGQLLFIVYNSVSDDDIYLVNPDGTNLTRLTNTPEIEYGVSASPIGDRIFFHRDDTLYLIDLTGAVIWSRSFPCSKGCDLDRTSWSPDGTELLFTFEMQSAAGTVTTLYQLAADGSQTDPTTFYEGVSARHGFSPDGRYFAYEAEGEIRVLDRTTQTTTALTSPQSGVGVYFYGWRPLP